MENAVDYEKTPSIDFDLASLSSFNTALSPPQFKDSKLKNGITALLSPPALLSPTIKPLSPSRKTKILQSLNAKLNRANPQHDHHHDDDTIDVNQSTNSSIVSNAATIDLEAEYDSIAVGKLTSLHLFDKKLASLQNIENLDRAYNLVHLNLHSNFIREMGMLDTLRKLKILNLSSNQIAEIGGLESLPALEELNLSSNRITRVGANCLRAQRNLLKLTLSYNYIDDIGGLSAQHFQNNHPSKLRYLDLKCNRIAALPQLQHLQHLKSLQTLILDEVHASKSLANPICAAHYKRVIADTLPSLKWLNLQLFDAEIHASKIKIVVNSKTPSPVKHHQQQQHRHHRARRQQHTNATTTTTTTRKPKRKHKNRNKNKTKTIQKEQQPQPQSFSESDSVEDDDDDDDDAGTESDSSVENHPPTTSSKNTKQSIKPRLMTPPVQTNVNANTNANKTEKRKKIKKRRKKPKQPQAEHEDEDEQESDDKHNDNDTNTPRIDALLHRFYRRSHRQHHQNTVPEAPPQPQAHHGQKRVLLQPLAMPSSVTEPQPQIAPVPIAAAAAVVHIPNSTQPIVAAATTNRIDFLVERVEKLFSHVNPISQPSHLNADDKKEEETPPQNTAVDAQTQPQPQEQAAPELIMIERSAQTIQLQTDDDDKQPPSQSHAAVELSTDITHDIHIHSVPPPPPHTMSHDSSSEHETHALQQQYEQTLSDANAKNNALDKRVQSLHQELTENMTHNKRAMEKVVHQQNENKKLASDKETLSEELRVRSTQLSQTQSQLQQLQFECQQREDMLQRRENEYRQSQLSLSEMKQSVKEGDEQNRLTSRVQHDRITELLATRHQFEHRLVLQQQSNEVLTQQIANLKTTIQTLDDDKKLWKESLHNLREQCSELTARLSDTQKNADSHLVGRQAEILNLEQQASALQNQVRNCLQENAENKRKLMDSQKASMSDIGDLKMLLKRSLESERKLKKTVLELNEVVAKQNKCVLKYKQDLQQSHAELKTMREKHANATMNLQSETSKTQQQQQQVSELQSSQERLQNSNLQLREQIQNTAQELKTLRDENARLQPLLSELESVRDKVRVKTVMLNDQNETIAALKSEKQSLEQRVSEWAAKEKETTHQQHELVRDVEELQKELDRYSDHKDELATYKNDADKYYKLYQETKEKLCEKEEIVSYVSNEVQSMKKMWDKEKKSIKEEFEETLHAKEQTLNDVHSDLTASKQQLQVVDNKLSSEKQCRQKWEKKCAEMNAQKVETEQEMRLILTEMDRYKKTAAQFAKAFNV